MARLSNVCMAFVLLFFCGFAHAENFQIASFDDFANDGWVDSRNSGLVMQDTSTFVEGTGSMAILYENNTGGFDDLTPGKSFASPLDLAGDENYTTKAVSLMLWTDLVGSSRLHQILMWDTDGNLVRYQATRPSETGWTEIVAPLKKFNAESTDPTTFNWSSVSSIQFYFYSPGVGGNIIVDDFRLVDAPVLMEDGQIASFDDFVNDGWVDSRYSGLVVQESDNFVEGTGAMTIQYENNTDGFNDLTPGKSFTSPLDLTDGDSYRTKAVSLMLWTDLVGSSRLHQILMWDTDGNLVRYQATRPSETGWTEIIAPLKKFNAESTDPTTFNWSSVSSIQFYFYSPGVGGNIIVDDFRLVDAPVWEEYQIASFDDFVNDGWADSRNNGLDIQDPNNYAEGIGSMRIKFEDVNSVMDVSPTKSFSPVLELADGDYTDKTITFMLWTEDLVGFSKLHQLILWDNSGNVVRYNVDIPEETGWTEIKAPLVEFTASESDPDAIDWDSISGIQFWLINSPENGEYGSSIYLDDMRITLTECEPSSAYVINADRATITVDGDASDWSDLASDTVNFDLASVPIQPNGDLNVNYRLAWDDSYLYFLIEELAGDQMVTEATDLDDLNDQSGGDVLYDSLALFFDFKNDGGNIGDAEGIDLWLFLGLASQGQDDLMMAWTNGNWGPHDPNMIDHGQYAASGSLGCRVVEAKMAWVDIESNLDTNSVIESAFDPNNVSPGFIFGCDPRLNDLELSWEDATTERGAAWLSGELWDPSSPTGNDPLSFDVKLVCSPADLDNDCDVDLEDFAIMASYWGGLSCDSCNDWCNGADADQLGTVDVSDLGVLANYWLDDNN